MTPREELETLAAMHLEVAAYVEKLLGPDREVDAKIAAVMGSGWLQAGAEVPAFTASLDAAMTLVPKGNGAGGERFKVEEWDGNGVHAPHVRASAWVAGAPRVYAATPALALCAAALHARASALTGYGEKG